MSTILRRPLRPAVVLACALACACRPDATTTPPPSDEHDDAEVEPPPAEETAPVADAPAVAPLPADRPARTIYRIELDRALARGPGWLLGQLDPTPMRQGGQFVGWRIGVVFPDAPDLCPPGCDLLAGDVILSVQGDALKTPQALEAMIARLDGLESLEVDRVRDGTRERVRYAIVDAP
jgi:type II secretory pathway component PulC